MLAAIGSPLLPSGAFTDPWSKLSHEFRHDHTVVAYDLMNEPTLVPVRPLIQPVQKQR